MAKEVGVRILINGIPEEATDSDIAEFIQFQITEQIEEMPHTNLVNAAYEKGNVNVVELDWEYT
jgi:hypothetical protein